MRRYLLLGILLFVCNVSFAQALDIPQVLSPNASELGKYGKMPVDYFSGLPQIQIPLTELRARNYSLPIYLSYHASGNKPDQHPGWVGQGWSLHAGGCINRIVNGKKDELTKEENARFIGINTSYQPGYLYHMDDTQNTSWNNTNLIHEINSHPYRDNEPDEFQVNIDDINASFYFTGNGKIKIASRNNVFFTAEYELSTSGSAYTNFRVFDFYDSSVNAALYKYISKIIITSKDGTRYHFGGQPEAIEFSFQQLTRYDVSYEWDIDEYNWDLIATANTWMLTRIERPDGESIYFEYQHSGVPLVFYDRHFAKYYFENGNGDQYNTLHYHQEKLNHTYSFLMPSYLSEIKCSQSRDSLSFKRSHTTELGYNINPTDFMNRMRIDTPFDSIKVRGWYLQLDTIKTLRGDIALEFSSDTTTRLKLNAVKFLDGKSVDHSYQMTYNPTDLPPYNARKSNIWGHYSRSTQYTVTANEVFIQQRMQVDTLLAQAEMLTSITYPTGGHTEFQYESNRFSKVAKQFPFEVVDSTGLSGGLRIKRITDYPVDGQPEIRDFTYTMTTGVSSGILSGTPACYTTGRQYTQIHYGQWMGASYISINEEINASYSLFSENPLNQLSNTDGRHTTYSRVTEYRPRNGKIVYYYTNHDEDDDFYLVLDRPPQVIETIENRLLNNPFTSQQLFRGLLESREHFDESGQLCQKEEYEYETDVDDGLYSFSFVRYFSPFFYRISLWEIITDFPGLKKKIVTTYPQIGSEPLVETTLFEYDDYRNLISETCSRGDSPAIKTQFKYAGEFSDGIYTSMVTAGKVGLPIERLKFNGDLLVEDELLTYKNFSGKILPWKHYMAPLGAGKSIQSWTGYSGNTVPAGYGNEDTEIVSRDTYGNPASVRELSGVYTYWTWDENGVNPLAMTKAGGSIQIFPMSESYSWDPDCKGLTSREHFNGRIEHYLYDDSGRLSKITNSNNDVVSRYEYSYGPSGNFVREITYTDAERTDSTVMENRFDGLGREQQVIKYGYGQNGADVSTWTEYDSCGRISKNWLPAATSTSNLAAFHQASAASYNDTCAFESIQYEDSPLDRPIKTIGAGANWHNADKGISTTYGTNECGSWGVNELICGDIKLEESGDSLILKYYGELMYAMLNVQRTEDEDGGVLLTFRDLENRTVLERRVLDPPSGTNPIFVDTYYIYDPVGRLLMAVPPELSSKVCTSGWNAGYSQAGWKAVRDYAFRYEYDDYGRCIAKKLPGADWIYYAYDKGDHLIFSQDGNQRARGVWGFYLADSHGRACLDGECVRVMNSTAEQYLLTHYIQTLRELGSGTDIHFGYGAESLCPLVSNYTVLNAYFWDGYHFIGERYQNGEITFRSFFFGADSYPEEPAPVVHSSAKGLMTGRISAPLGTLPDNSNNKWHKTVWYYNEKENITRQTDCHASGDYIRETNAYDFRELLVDRTRSHFPSSSSVKEHYWFTYDRWGKSLVTTHSLNGASPVVLSSNQYDALGRLASVEHGGCDSLATSFSYNVRGWTRSISSPYFTENLYYETPRDTTTVPCWSGNISAIDWKAGADRNYDSAFDFRYDRMSRLTEALWNGNGGGRFNDRKYTYDLNGSISKIDRENSRPISQSTHTHTVTIWSLDGNRMGTSTNESITDLEGGLTPVTPVWPGLDPIDPRPDHPTASPNATTPATRTAYGYDANGNLSSSWTETQTSVLDPWIVESPFFETQYNQLNLPSYRRSSSTEEWTVYSADGQKQAVHHHKPASISSLFPSLNTPEVNWKFEYVGNYIFRDGNLSRILTDTGHIDMTGPSPVYQWWLTDHLGNVRVVADSLGNISQTNHYDPYGGEIGVKTFTFTMDSLTPYSATENLFRFGAKEWNETFSDYDFSARYFSTSSARFTTQDPLAEKTPHLSPYAYCAGNPMRFVDPTGMWHWGEDDDNLYWDSGDDAETLAEFLEIDPEYASQIYKRTVFRKMREGSYIPQSKLWYEIKNKGVPKVWNTEVAVLHYYFGKGKPADIGWDSNGQIFNSRKVEQILTTFRVGGIPNEDHINLNLTLKTFHIGKTRINFDIEQGRNTNKITFTTLVGDGFWDPNYLAEEIGKIFFNRPADGKGARYELGGVPFEYIPRKRTYFSKPSQL